MSRLVSRGSSSIAFLRGIVCVLGVAACVVVSSAVIVHDVNNHYRSGEVSRLAPHRAVLAQSNDLQNDKARVTARIETKIPLPITIRTNPIITIEPAPRPSLCRLLLRLRLGPRFRTNEDPSNLLL
jgi:hypothetical protein